jgi:ADP-heptose:LPS heptosyltransferase
MFRRSLPQPVCRIVVLTKHRFMGDAIVAVPLLRAARLAFRDARITLVTGHQAAVALESCPYFDQIVRYSPRDDRYSVRDMRRTLRADDPKQPDVCLVADRSLRSAYIAFLLGGRVRAGFASEWRGPLLTHRVPYRRDVHEIECFLDILRAVAPEGKDSPPYDPTPQLFLTDAERAKGADILAEREAIGSVLVGIQPGASYAAKQWDPRRFAAVAAALATDGAGIVLLGNGPAERDASRAMRQAMPGVPAVDLTDVTSLRETLAVLSHLSLFIGNDSGITHAAASLGVPTVGVFGPTRAAKWGHVGPRGAVLAAPDGDLARLDTAPALGAARRLLNVVAVDRPIPAGARR